MVSFFIYYLLVSLCFVVNSTHAREEGVRIAEGNLALPVSQQPITLLSFGQTIVSKGTLLGFLEGNFFQGPRNAAGFEPSILYGIRDDLAVFATIPFFARQRDGSERSSGMADISVQFEYECANWDKKAASNDATIVGTITLPSGSATKTPPTGFGSPSFFFGFTIRHLSIKWYAFTSNGFLLTTKNPTIKFGNQFFYQFGWGRNIEAPKNWIFLFMFEMLGQYSQRDTVQGVVNRNSGGNTIIFLPSLWFSSQRFIGQVGVGWFGVQHLFGSQNKNKYLVAANIGWKF